MRREKHASVAQAASSLTHFLGPVDPQLKSLESSILSAASRSKPITQNRTKISLKDYCILIDFASENPIFDRPATLSLLQYNGLLRISEAINLRQEDVVVEATGKAGSIFLARSKTDQKGKGTSISICLTKNEYTIYERHRRLCQGALFLFQSASTGRPISYSTASKELKSLFSNAGLAERNYTSHAFRGGAASNAVEAGKDSASVMKTGRWRSPAAFAAYLRMTTIKNAEGSHGPEQSNDIEEIHEPQPALGTRTFDTSKTSLL
ncbi:unnamed protein product [Caenorhabditis auriculariae]|uniref:Tyr recombinase domain-containing protein n=1 Tax=Caenorhabditis auriculariae TaxID=2777116 RepID=A0A8S1H384_9PELO|nr:unnamed protein product [Caenorhabditis auriculariae]